jgi:hypothetical protein
VPTTRPAHENEGLSMPKTITGKRSDSTSPKTTKSGSGSSSDLHLFN